MKICIRIIIVVFSILVLTPIFGQEVHPDCTNPKIISLPTDLNSNNQIQDEIYYQPADKYTYWYKVNVDSDCEISYRLGEISGDDFYDLLIYKYQGENFCNDIVKNQEAPTLNKKAGVLSLKQGDVYYLGVLHLRGKGCGHVLFLDSEKGSTTIKAIQNECFEEALAAAVEEEIEEEIKEEIPTNQLKGIVVNRSTQKELEAVVNVIGEDGEVLMQLNSTINNGFVLANFNEDKVIISVNKFGYNKFLDTLDVVDHKVKIDLDPFKIGEKFVMRRIYFHPNTYALKDEAEEELEKLKQFMLDNDGYKYQIQGHTNGNRSVKKTNKYISRGEEWNFSGSAKKLSKLRAEKIKDYLIENGVKNSQIETEGFGGNKMIVNKPKNMKQASRNIRVEVVIIE